MATEEEEELEELADEVKSNQIAAFLANLTERYNALFGHIPPNTLSIQEIQHKIAAEMARRGLRPYKL